MPLHSGSPYCCLNQVRVHYCIFSNPFSSGSDIWLHTNDAVVIKLDSDKSGDDSDFFIFDKDDNIIFDVDESGTVLVNGTVVHSSDRNRKEAFETVDTQAVLEGVAQLPLLRWQYKGQSVPHLGPMAQDFYAAFGLGQDEVTIASVDADGVALAANQGLYKQNQDLITKTELMQSELDQLKALVAALANY